MVISRSLVGISGISAFEKVVLPEPVEPETRIFFFASTADFRKVFQSPLR